MSRSSQLIDPLCDDRVLNMESVWTEEEEEEPAEHPYYNNIPGKMPPPGGFIDTRLGQSIQAEVQDRSLAHLTPHLTICSSNSQYRVLHFRAPEWHSGLRHCVLVQEVSLQSLV